MSRFKGILIKKILYSWRSIPIIIVQIIIVITFMVLVHIGSNSINKDEVKMVLNLDAFKGSKVPYQEISSSKEVGVMTAKLTKIYFQRLGSGNIGEKIDFSHLRNNSDTVLTEDPNLFSITNYYLQRAKALGLAQFNQKMVIGVQFQESGDGLEIWSHFNRIPFHSSSISISYTLNTILGFFTSPEHRTTFVNHPLPIKRDKGAAMQASLIVAICMIVGLCLPSTIFIFHPLKEREVGNKHLQMVSGVSPLLYWAATIFWDYINHVLTVILLLSVFVGFNYPEFTNDGNIYIIVLILIVYGLAIHPFMYAFHFLFKSAATGTGIGFVMNIFGGIGPVFGFFLLDNIKKSTTTVDMIGMMLLPQYSMARCFMELKSNYDTTAQCEKMKYTTACVKFPKGPCCRETCDNKQYPCLKFVDDILDMELPGIGRYLVAMSIQYIVFWLITLAIDYDIFQRIWYKFRPAEMIEVEMEATLNMDSDVAEEKRRIEFQVDKESEDALIVSNLYKRYGNFIAVDHLSIGIPEKECFGLLGQNGAGKTTVFKMLTGEVMATQGNAFLWSYDIQQQKQKVQENIGYCPQFDGLMDYLTGRETLHMFARLKGIPELHVPFVCRRLLDIMLLTQYADKFTSVYSGGNKRKLSTAIALVGDPAFILLDEPSTGMDPEARRHLWNVLTKVREYGRTLVLTSHSMEECDALCTRIAIMVNGQFMCLGTPQHLKNKFGQGYTLIVRMGTVQDPEGAPGDMCPAPTQPLVDFILNRFPASRVFDDHQGYVHFQVPDATVSLSVVFKLMEESKSQFSLDDYSVHQTTLEQVFLSFARYQNVAKCDNTPMCKRVCCC